MELQMKTLIVILVLFSSVLFAKDWILFPTDLTMSEILELGYELKEITTDPESREGLYRVFYHFINNGTNKIFMCSIDIEFGTPSDTYCYMEE